MATKWSRRDWLKTLTLAAGGSFSLSAWAINETGEKIILPDDAIYPKLAKPITAITLGAGSRGNVYGNYALQFPEQLDIIGVAEPIPIRNQRYTDKHQIKAENRFKTWEDVFKRPKFADAILITTPDDLHYAPCIEALKQGYDILLEKPMAPTEQECREILRMTQKTGRIVAVCHVLRYAPYFIKLRSLMQSGAIGEIISVQHLEPIEHIHMSHSFVRGNWHNAQKTTPIILAKSCHDLDILRWMIGKPAQKIQAFGQLNWFKKENAPVGSTPRCMDGCAVESTCPYSALKIYHRKRTWTYVFDLPNDKTKHGEAILEYLRTTNYGRCVYQMENNQCDHYICNIEFEGGVTASFSMEAFTPWGGRRTRVMGSMGFIEGDMDKFTIYDFKTEQSETLEAKAIEIENYKNSGHGGGDWRLLADWIQAVAQQNTTLLTSTVEASIESHLMAFKAETSRKNQTVETVKI